jgi:P27 family predicted phage terminase small subunit
MSKAAKMENVSHRITCPRWVSKEMRPTYKELVRHLRERASYAAVDEGLIRVYIETLGNLRACQAVVNMEGVLIDTPQGPKSHPSMVAQGSLSGTLTKVSSALAIGPAARKRLQLVESNDKKPKSSPWAKSA